MNDNYVGTHRVVNQSIKCNRGVIIVSGSVVNIDISEKGM